MGDPLTVSGPSRIRTDDLPVISPAVREEPVWWTEDAPYPVDPLDPHADIPLAELAEWARSLRIVTGRPDDRTVEPADSSHDETTLSPSLFDPAPARPREARR